MGMSQLQNYFRICSGKCFSFYLQDTQIKIMVNKKGSLRLSYELKIYLRYLHQHQNLSIRSLSQRYPQFSLPTIWRHATKKIEVHPKQAKGKGGRQPKFTWWRSIIWLLHYTSKKDANFTSKRTNLYSGVSSVHCGTVRRVLNKYRYLYRQAIRKGQLTDLKTTRKCVWNFQKTEQSTMTMGCSRLEYDFTLDAKQFIHKANSKDQAKTPKTLVWRKKHESVIKGCTWKEYKAGYGGKVANSFVAISLGKGICYCKHYEKLSDK